MAPICPRCGSARTDTCDLRHIVPRLYPPTADYWYCSQCGHIWVVPKAQPATPYRPLVHPPACPHCHSALTQPAPSFKSTTLDFFQCVSCGHKWLAQKQPPAAPKAL